MSNKLTSSEALYGFCAWLTTRKERTIISAVDDVAPLLPLIETFCKTNGLKEPAEDWTKNLIHPVNER